MWGFVELNGRPMNLILGSIVNIRQTKNKEDFNSGHILNVHILNKNLTKFTYLLIVQSPYYDLICK